MGFVDGFADAKACIEFIVDFNRADFDTFSASGTVRLVYISRVFGNGDGKVSGGSCNLFDFG